MEKPESIDIEVAYGNARAQRVIGLRVPLGTSVRGAIERSRILEHFPDIDLTQQAVGVFGVLRELDDSILSGERIEIYRCLLLDPKEARRRRAAASA